MASSDDEGTEVMHDVSEYHFVDDKDEPASIAELPIVWGNNEVPLEEVREIFLRGYTDNRRLSVYRKVKAWRFDISLPRPEISVLSSENEWIKLLQARKSYLEFIRTVIITVHFLHLLKKKPDISSKALWDKLSKRFSFEEQPCENDLVEHISLIRVTVQLDANLKDSNVLNTFLKNPIKKRILDEDVGTSKKSCFIVDDIMADGTDMKDDNQQDSDDEEDDGFDYVCALCDNGGDILCCEGRCLRSFHATAEAGEDSQCKSLGLSDERVKRLQMFCCNNCQYNQHQCYACGKLGSSDKSAGAEVFRCVIPTCGHFYHPHCVAKLLSPRNDSKVKELREKISSGEQFSCPIHECYVCKEGENKNERNLQFAVCRRCPKSYHRKCLPREIVFDGDEDDELMARAWEGLLPNGRILIYCLEHEIDEDLCTPLRNHIIFPDLDAKKKRVSSISSNHLTALSSEYDSKKSRPVKKPNVVEKFSTSEKQGDSLKKTEMRRSVQISSGQRKALGTGRMALKKSSEKFKKPIAPEDGTSLGDRIFSMISQNLDLGEPVHDGELEQTQHDECVLAESNSYMALDVDAKERILSIIEDTASEVTIEDIEKNCKVPGTSVYSSKSMDKSITLGKVEAFVEAISAAQQKLDNGGSVENAKSICEPRLLNQIVRWKDKLKVYLAPFIFGMRYTSFGRHFTTVDKLKVIVDRLHWYVEDGDTIVDFCCGSNDFSLILKQKLDEIGKRRCSFKNYDIYPPKNDFNFEKRDWFSVHPKELPSGSNLIMGLNPPFGMYAHLANKFISKALQFKPKLLILIVPQETKRLDTQDEQFPYDLLWEDDQLLSGKSFYLPGSIDVNGKQMEDWNVSAPPLYLWSHPDWTSTHKSIAEQKGHLGEMPEKVEPNENHIEMMDFNPPTECPGKSSTTVDEPCLLNENEQPLEQRETGSGKGKSSVIENTQKNDCSKSKIHSREGEQETKLVEKQGTSAVEPSDSHHSDSSLSRYKASSNQDMRMENPSNTDHRSISRSHQRQAQHGSDKEVDRRPKGKDTEDPNPSFRGKKFNKKNKKRKGYMRKEDSTSGGGLRERDFRENISNKNPALGGNNWEHASSPGLDYSVRPQHEQFYPQQRESTMGYQTFPMASEPFRRDNMMEQVPLYAIPGPGYANQTMNHPLGVVAHGVRSIPQPGLPHHRLLSAIQRYRPTLDELNFPRVNGPHIVDRNGMHDPRRGHPRPDSLGFVPNPYHPSSTHSSSGWLNE
ncbi:hypothetical protein Leryth_022232 [Lithospermum erythrorhizon]|nr:hypothetical protein Leryth_022232 [Lithospermum erythrorhizon]